MEGAGLERAVFQLGLLLVMRKSVLIKLSSKFKLTIQTNRIFCDQSMELRVPFFAPAHGSFLGFKCHRIDQILSFLSLTLITRNKMSSQGLTVPDLCSCKYTNTQLHVSPNHKALDADFGENTSKAAA